MRGDEDVNSSSKRLFVIVGSYAQNTSSGVHVYEFDLSTARLHLNNHVSGFKNPTFLIVDPTLNRVRAIAETLDQRGTAISEIASFDFDVKTGKLALLQRVSSVCAPACHIGQSPDHDYVVISSYHGGVIGLHCVTDNGQLSVLKDQKKHTGQSIDPIRQTTSHVHCAVFSPDGKHIIVLDLGSDQISVYTIDQKETKLCLLNQVYTAEGAGPRHLTFHPTGRFVYVVHELDSTITTYTFDSVLGTLSPLQTLTTLPSSFVGINTTAEILVDQEARFLYASNRGHDSIAVYEIDPMKGTLRVAQHVSTQGKHPRHFQLTPDGQYLLVANRDTNNVTIFHVNRSNGRLTYSGESVHIDRPVCIQCVLVHE